jgi:hypothetical protein
MIDLQKCTEFSDVLFATLHAVDLFPGSLEASMRDFEKHSLLLLEQIEQVGIDAGWHEWTTNILKQIPAEERQEKYPEILVLKRWIESHHNFFADEDNLCHLRKSIGGRAHQWLFSVHENLISLSDAEDEWGHSNLRANARGRLPMWKIGRNWVTTRAAMRAIYGASA